MALLFSICGFYFRIPHGFFSSGLLVCILGRGGGGKIAGKRGMDAHFPKSTCRRYNHHFSYQKAIREAGRGSLSFFLMKNNVQPRNLCVLSTLVVSGSLRSHGLKPTRLPCSWNSPDKNTALGSHSLLQGIFPTQGPNPGQLHCRQILYHLIHHGSPEIHIQQNYHQE